MSSSDDHEDGSDTSQSMMAVTETYIPVSDLKNSPSSDEVESAVNSEASGSFREAENRPNADHADIQPRTLTGMIGPDNEEPSSSEVDP